MKSEICLHHLDGPTRLVLAQEGRIEAPNWSPDGTYLLVNSEGRLYRLPLDAPRLIPVDTGFATRLNNDHGIAPDGQSYMFCDKVETGKSCIYRIPSAGGAPERITENIPSWWHGWSPDGAEIAYTAVRNGEFTVAVCPATGGSERCLVSGFDHVDGPDFTRDGWIWFNAERNQTSDLWRIRADGSDLQQMTDDHRVNWFPHPSPSGQIIVYLAYPEGTEGHPADLSVELRCIDPEGGPTRAIASFTGGQGTINVPSWSPDGKAFAYIRYIPDDAP